MPRQTTLDGFLVRASKRPKSDIKRQSGEQTTESGVQHDSIETNSSSSSLPLKSAQKVDHINVLKLIKPQLELSGTPSRSSPRLQMQRDKLLPRPTLSGMREKSP